MAIFLASLSKVFTQSNKTCQVKNMIFFGIFILQIISKTDSLPGEVSKSSVKKELQEKPLEGLGSRHEHSSSPS